MAKLEKLVDQAMDHLDHGENIEAVVQGTYEVMTMGYDSTRSGIFLATDRRLVFYAKKMGGYDLESFPYGNISSFEQSKNMMGHSFSFFASGNRVHVKWVKGSDELATFINIAKTRMGRTPTRAASMVQSVPMPPNVMDQLKALGGLREAGILTDEEFTSKKRELLSRL